MREMPSSRGAGWRSVAALLAVLQLVSCDALSSSTSVVIRPENSVIMPFADGPELVKPCRTPPAHVAGFWEPTREQIARMEAGLPAAVNPLLRREKKDGGKISYHRQYIGLVRPDGRRAIYVNAFATDLIRRGGGLPADTVRWRSSPVNSCDGWLGFWSIEFDVETGTFSGFDLNGRA
ncbi:MAG TPA: hypothetical protein VF665_10525 [Longimicrobium sp.]|uniref:hypothetical protein n=1 Tax=Longimicrobium sp. TaxID=2029185 RepID=UPI002ED975D6